MNNLSSLTSLPSLTAVLKAHDLFAKKSLGQHFLLDLNITDKIARLAAPHDFVAEVGPGPGGLTRSLLMAGTKQVVVVEKDPRFLPVLQQISDVADERLNIIEGDALKVDLTSLSDVRPMRICANLPYNVGTKLVINWLSANPIFWDRMVLMLQKEVAERLAAKPSTKAYGRLAVLAQSVAQTHIALQVPASAFTPPPKVDSAVIVLDILPQEKRYPDLKLLARITASAFGQRRKMLRKSLKPLAKDFDIEVEGWLDAAEIEHSLRPETLEIQKFHALANVIREKNKNS